MCTNKFDKLSAGPIVPRSVCRAKKIQSRKWDEIIIVARREIRDDKSRPKRFTVGFFLVLVGLNRVPTDRWYVLLSRFIFRADGSVGGRARTTLSARVRLVPDVFRRARGSGAAFRHIYIYMCVYTVYTIVT